MSDNAFEVLLAIEVGGVPIELVGKFTDEITDISLTEYAKQMLREVSIGSVTAAVDELLIALKIKDKVGALDFQGELANIPGVGSSIAALMDAPIHLTDLEYTKDESLVIGVLIDLGLDLDLMKVSQIGLKVTHTFDQEAA